MSYVNSKFSLANGETKVIPLNRWARDAYSVQLDSGTSVLVQGTLNLINRGETAVWATLDDGGGVALTAATGLSEIQHTPLEAIRITATGTCVGTVMQSGD